MDTQQEITTYYNSIAKKYDKDRFENTYGRYIHQQEKNFLDKNWLYTSKPTLDIACGTGRWTHLTKMGVDISPDMIEIAKEKYPKRDFFISNADDLPFRNNEIKASLAFHLVMHLSESKLKSILDEVHRVTEKKGFFIFDFPSKKRRNLFNKNRKGWHASYSLSIKELKSMMGEKWELKTHQGVLFFPIHRIPKSIRKYFSFFDNLFCNSWLKNYASYLIVKLEKKG